MIPISPPSHSFGGDLIPVADIAARLVSIKRARAGEVKVTRTATFTEGVTIVPAPASIRPLRPSKTTTTTTTTAIATIANEGSGVKAKDADVSRLVNDRLVQSSRLWAARAKATSTTIVTIPPPVTYSTFDRQIEAFAAADASPPSNPLSIFSEETAAGGIRRFIAATREAMWARVLASPPHARHFYEILREDTPCHLYFDLEFADTAGAGGVPNDSVGYLLWRVALELKAQYAILLTSESVIHLESSTPAKFSRHLVCRLRDGSLFRSTAHTGAFVSALVSKLNDERGSPNAHPLLEQLWRCRASSSLSLPSLNDDVLNNLTEEQLCALESGIPIQSPTPSPPFPPPFPPPSPPQPVVEQFLVDTAVYTRNRAMRMYLSCKFGKTAPLLPSVANTVMRREENILLLGEGDTQTLDYWLTYARGSSESIETGTTPLSTPTTTTPTSSAWTTPQIQIGSRAWENRLWMASLITDGLPPLWKSIEHAAVAAVGGTAAAAAAVAAVGGTVAQLSHHPTQGFRILYAVNALDTSKSTTKRTTIARKSPTVGGIAETTEGEEGGGGGGGAATTSSLITRVNGEGETAPFPDLVAWVCANASGDEPLTTTTTTTTSRGGSARGSVRVSRWSSTVTHVNFQVNDEIQRTRVVQSLSLVLSGTRWCEGIRRHHQSNGVYWVVNMMNGVATQRCFDPDCRARGVYGLPRNVPAEILPQQAPIGGVLISSPSMQG
jgi:hypothetical protein